MELTARIVTLRLAETFVIAREASDEDDVVPTPEHAGPFADRFGGTARIELVGCTGPHVDASCFRGEDLVRWFDSFDA